MTQIKSFPTYVRARQLAQQLGISLATLWRWEREGRLPRGTRLSPHVVAWRDEIIEGWLRDREAAR
jgi:prophage regulatory protein